jgi:UDP-N-acetylglucosamine--N-acetylmuramyl-(pentapeptide) pyrophosphoryl-undecaprenol N-acetylglucosamine transferase
VKILVAGGGTAGHVFPAIAVAERLVADGHEVRFAGTRHGQEARLVPAAGFELIEIEASPFVRSLSMRALTAPIVALRSVGRVRPIVETADVVLGMGGYVSVPVALAALRSRRPLVLHEQNAVPGLANRALARRARAVALAFVEAARHLPRRARTVVTGNPVRPAILAVPEDRARLATEAYEEFDLDPAARTVVVFGGSQGALHIDRAIADTVARSTPDGVQYLLLTGSAHEASVRRVVEASARVPVRVRAFLERMELAYAIADLVVARAGATTVAEISVCGVPGILVPYPYATGRHQDANARALERAGCATVVLDDDLDGPVLAERIEVLLADPERLRAMAGRARAWSKPEAADALARAVTMAAEAA